MAAYIIIAIKPVCFPIHLIKEGKCLVEPCLLGVTCSCSWNISKVFTKKIRGARRRTHRFRAVWSWRSWGSAGGKWRISGICGFSHFCELWPFYDSFHNNFFGTDQLNIWTIHRVKQNYQNKVVFCPKVVFRHLPFVKNTNFCSEKVRDSIFLLINILIFHQKDRRIISYVVRGRLPSKSRLPSSSICQKY